MAWKATATVAKHASSGSVPEYAHAAADACTFASLSNASDERRPKPVSIPTTVVHGTLDTVVPLEPVRQIVQKLFTNVK